MDRQIDSAQLYRRTNIETETNKSGAEQSAYTSGHLMCRTSLWGIAGFFGCAYFVWISFSDVTHNKYDWPHDIWTAATYIVWILLLAGLALGTRCVRERLFFGLLVVNFVIGCGLTFWYNIPSGDVRTARIGTGTLWAVAALVSLTTIGNSRELRNKNTNRQDE
jgi:hypothetical protein